MCVCWSMKLVKKSRNWDLHVVYKVRLKYGQPLSCHKYEARSEMTC